jgi:PBSX family phage terminase large subunit
MTTPSSLSLEHVLKLISPKQLISIVESQRAPKSLWTGAVSSGKTIASLIAFLMAIPEAPNQGLIVVVGKTIQTIERNLLNPLQSVEIFGELAKAVHHTPGSTTATILGREIELIGAHNNLAEGRIRGSTIALAYVDEATLVPQSFWMMLMSRLRVKNLSKLLATTNPDGPGHFIRKDFLLKATELRLAHWHFTIADNPSLAPEFIADLHTQYVGLWYRRFILGEWCLAEGAVYDMWDETRHVVDILPRITRYIALGIDYGTVNPFAGLLLGLGEDRRLYLTNEYRYDSKVSRRSKTDAEYSQALTSWLDKLQVAPEWTAVDPSAASFVQQLYRDGRVTPTLANNAVVDGIRQLSSLMAMDQFRVHRSCKGWIEEVAGYSWDPKKAEKGEDAPIKTEDHSLDAGRYAVHTTEAIWHGQLKEAA